MSELPPAARARIERILADLELAVIDARREPEPVPPELNSGALVFSHFFTPVQPIVLEHFGAIVAVISPLPWTASERRQSVTQYQEQLLALYGLERSRFLEALRMQPSWATFQETLREAERTDIPPMAQQLRTLKEEARWTIEQMVDATKINKRTIERHMNVQGLRVPKPGSLTAYERAFSTRAGTSNYPHCPAAAHAETPDR